VSAEARTRAIRRAVLWGLVAAKAVGGWGVGWDIRWHLLVGRDSFWIPPHVMTYASVTVAAMLCAGVLLRETWLARHGQRPAGTVDVAGLVGTRGFHLASWGMALTILAAPVDDLWHRLFGIDVTLWSPPHLLGLGGAQLSTLALMLIALEVWPAPARARTTALLVSGTLLLALFHMIADPAVLTAFVHGGLRFFTWAILGGGVFGFTLVLTARLTGWRSAPLVLALGAIVVQASIIGMADLGFALTRPVSTIEAAIAAEPRAPVAIAHEMSRRNGTVPGRSMLLRGVLLAPAALMVLADVRRRWRRGALLAALALVVVSGILLGQTPALRHAVPEKPDRAIALALTVVTSLVGAWSAVRVARWFSTPPAARAWVVGGTGTRIPIRETAR
jgi:hypothetical protein